MDAGTLHIGTDRSHVPGTSDGAGAGVLASYRDSERILKVGCKCEVEGGISSLTMEQYGLMSGIMALWTLLAMHREPTRRTVVYTWIDNAETLRRINECNETKLHLNDYAISDYGVYTLVCEAILKLPKKVSIECKKIKSHQDLEINGAHELSFEARLNMAADEYANYIRTTVVGPQNVFPVYKPEGLVIIDNCGCKVKDIAKYLKEVI